MNIQGSFQKAGNWLGKKGATLAVAGAVGASLAPGVTKAADDQVLLNPGGVDQICMSFAPLEMVYQTRNGGDLGKAQFLITLDNNHPTATLERPAEIDVRILAPGLHYHLHVTSNWDGVRTAQMLESSESPIAHRPTDLEIEWVANSITAKALYDVSRRDFSQVCQPEYTYRMGFYDNSRAQSLPFNP